MFIVLLVALAVASVGLYKDNFGATQHQQPNQLKNVLTVAPEDSKLATEVLNSLDIKGRAPKTDYDRSMFLDDWGEENSCDKRNIILQRDLNDTVIDEDGCVVLSGQLYDPYTGTDIDFKRGSGTSGDVHIDHIVSLSEAWQKGARQLSSDERNDFANDSLNLLAVDGPANIQKSNADAATWLPSNKLYRCAFVARQIAVKSKYELWVTRAEKDSITRVLNNCPNQVLPIEND